MLPRSRHRFSLVEILAASVIALLAGVILTSSISRPPHLGVDVEQMLAERARLENQYGPDRHSEHFEEWIVRDHFKDQREGFFVDVGAYDYRRGSNTFFLETVLNWSGLAVDPQAHFEEGYKEHRKRTKFFPLFVSDRSSEIAKVFVVNNNLTQVSAFPSRRTGPDVQSFEAPTITLTDLLDSQSVTRIDFLSIDVELAEPKVLAGFDIDRFRPRLVCIEAHEEVRQAILNYFAKHGYALLGRYLRADIHNLYFQPLQ